MPINRLRLYRTSLAVAAGWALLLPGCASVWWNSLLDPSQVGNFHENVVTEIQQTISFRDSPTGVPGATDPMPDDLVQTVEEYELGVGDQVAIRILDLLERGVESEFRPVVDELGYVFVPTLGWIHVQGLTLRELRAEIIQRLAAAGIFRPEMGEPTVVLEFLIQQQRVYHISGAIQAAGRYRIIPPDFRLREAINQAGGLDPSVKTIFVLRNDPKPKRVIDRGVRPGPVGAEPSQELPAPPVSPIGLSELAGGPASPPARVLQTPAPAAVKPAPAAKAAQIPDPPLLAQAEPAPLPTEQELMDLLAPAPQTQPTTPGPAQPAAPAETVPATRNAPFIFVNDGFIPVEPPPAAQPGTPPGPARAEPAPQAGDTTTKPVDWQELASEGQQRIIRIPAEKLLNGDPNYNIVIRHDDWIRLDAGHVGVFYVMGHVLRPGVYSLSGTEITLRQAIAAAGGLDALAWPSRCEIVRRLDGDREETTQWDLERIMNGKDPDIYLKPEDLINVGTHAVAPLLATIRNSFRLTYGFGFVYDRNFADIDAFGPQFNPTERRRSQLQQRFPGLFP